jgi:hypothetical protein
MFAICKLGKKKDEIRMMRDENLSRLNIESAILASG